MSDSGDEIVAAAHGRVAAHPLTCPTPFVTLTFAQTVDGALAAAPGAPLGVSSPAALRMTHGLRAAHDCIVVGVGTVLADDPSLTVRLAPGASPVPVILDAALRTPLACRLMAAPECVRPVILCSGAHVDAAFAARRAALTARGAAVVAVPAGPHGDGVDIAGALRALESRGLRSAMVEGGPRVIASFLAEALRDGGVGRAAVGQVVITIAPALAPAGVRVPPGAWPAGRAVRLEGALVRVVGGDAVFAGALTMPAEVRVP